MTSRVDGLGLTSAIRFSLSVGRKGVYIASTKKFTNNAHVTGWIVIERNGGAMDCRSGFLGTWIHKNVCSSTRWAVGSYLRMGSGPEMAWLTTVLSPCIQIATWFSFICDTEIVIQWYRMTLTISKFVCGHYKNHTTDKIILFVPYLSQLFLGVLGAHKWALLLGVLHPLLGEYILV